MTQLYIRPMFGRHSFGKAQDEAVPFGILDLWQGLRVDQAARRLSKGRDRKSWSIVEAVRCSGARQ
jgi:hypothetical protein